LGRLAVDTDGIDIPAEAYGFYLIGSSHAVLARRASLGAADHGHPDSGCVPVHESEPSSSRSRPLRPSRRWQTSSTNVDPYTAEVIRAAWRRTVTLIDRLEDGPEAAKTSPTIRPCRRYTTSARSRWPEQQLSARRAGIPGGRVHADVSPLRSSGTTDASPSFPLYRRGREIVLAHHERHGRQGLSNAGSAGKQDPSWGRILGRRWTPLTR
jgi:hypothetical protein